MNAVFAGHSRDNLWGLLNKRKDRSAEDEHACVICAESVLREDNGRALAWEWENTL